MDSIQHLNTKIWYRGLKVLYILSFIFVIYFVSAEIFKEYQPTINTEKSYVSCFNGSKKPLNSFSAGKYAGIGHSDLSTKYLLEYIQKNKNELVEICGSKVYGMDKLEIVKYDRNWLMMIWKLLLSFLTIIIIFEAIRRIFYYVVFGVWSVKYDKRK